MKQHQNTEKKDAYRLNLCKTWYRITGLERLLRDIAVDQELDELARYELRTLIQRRIEQLGQRMLERN